MEMIWQNILDWLQSVGLQLGGRVPADVGPAVAQATDKLDMPSLLALAAALVIVLTGIVCASRSDVRTVSASKFSSSRLFA